MIWARMACSRLESSSGKNGSGKLDPVIAENGLAGIFLDQIDR